MKQDELTRGQNSKGPMKQGPVEKGQNGSGLSGIRPNWLKTNWEDPRKIIGNNKMRHNLWSYASYRQAIT